MMMMCHSFNSPSPKRPMWSPKRLTATSKIAHRIFTFCFRFVLYVIVSSLQRRFSLSFCQNPNAPSLIIYKVTWFMDHCSLWAICNCGLLRILCHWPFWRSKIYGPFWQLLLSFVCMSASQDIVLTPQPSDALPHCQYYLTLTTSDSLQRSLQVKVGDCVYVTREGAERLSDELLSHPASAGDSLDIFRVERLWVKFKYVLLLVDYLF